MAAARVLEGNIIPPPKLSLRAVPLCGWLYLQRGEKECPFGRGMGGGIPTPSQLPCAVCT